MTAMNSSKHFNRFLRIAQVLFVLVFIGGIVLWIMNEIGAFGERPFWIFTPGSSGRFNAILLLFPFVLVSVNHFSRQRASNEADERQPALPGPKTLNKYSYRQYLRYKLRDFNVKGLSTHGPYTLELARVFVEMSVAPKPFQAARSNLIPLPTRLQTGQHEIWAYLQQTEQNYAIIGPPGSGKTTLLSHIGLALTSSWLKRRQAEVPNKRPLLLTLLEHAEAIASEGNKPYTLEDAVRADLRKWKKEVKEGWVRQGMEKGTYLVLLDGLDEVADRAQRERVVSWVERQMKAFPKSQFVVTSRPHGYRTNPIAGVTTLELRPYKKQQQAQFVRNWYLANEVISRGGKEDAGVRMAAKEGADDLLWRIGVSADLTEIAVNPLLLTMIATVHRFRSALPRRRVELYDEIFSVFLGTWREARGIEQELSLDQRKQVLQPLAWALMTQHQRQIPTAEAIKIIEEPLRRVDQKMAPAYFLQMIREQSGLLLEQENGVLAFAYLPFQEYLAARHLQSDTALLPSILKCVGESWWHEMLLLYAAQQDATPIIEACLATEGGLQPGALILAIECNREASQVSPATRQRLENVLAGAIEGEEKEEIRKIVAEAWLQRRLKRLSQHNEAVYIDSSLVTHTEYQLFLNEKRNEGKQYQPDHWLTIHHPKEAGLHPVVGVRPSDAAVFCEWLTEREKGKFRFRLPTRLETQELVDRCQETGYWIRDEGDFALKIDGAGPAISGERLQHYRARDLALDRGLERDLALDRANDLDADLALSRARTLARALDRARAFDRALDRALDLDIELVLDRALDRALDIDRTRALDRDLALNRDRALTLDLDQALARARALAPDRALARSLALARARARDRARAFTRDRAHSPERDRARSEFRGVLYLIGTLIWEIRQEQLRAASILNKQSPELQRDQAFLEALAAEYFDAFVDLCIFEERIQGKLPAFEGICIVRERVKKAE